MISAVSWPGVWWSWKSEASRVAIIPREQNWWSRVVCQRRRYSEFNSKMLGAFVEEWGGEPVIFPMVPDDYEIKKRAVREAAQKADVL